MRNAGNRRFLYDHAEQDYQYTPETGRLMISYDLLGSHLVLECNLEPDG